MKYCYIRRLCDGKLLDIPEKDLASTLKRGGFEEIKDVGKVYENSLVEFKLSQRIECPICGREFKNSAGLGKHKLTHK